MASANSENFTPEPKEKSLPDFQTVVAYILRATNIDPVSASMDNDGVYTVTLDCTLKIYLIGTQPGFFNIWSFPGKISPTAPSKTLFKMLAVNSFHGAHPFINVGVESESHEVIVWTRQSLAELNAAKANKLFDRLAEAAGILHQSLKVPSTSQQERSAHAIQALLRSKI